MNNFLLWIGGLLVVLLCALFAVPHFVDWNGYRGAFEEEATRILGREVRVAGRVNLRVLPTPFVRFEKVRLSDADGVTGEPFFRADDLTLWLSPAALLRGTLEANRIELHRPILKLRLDANGGGNWQSIALKSGALPFVLSDAALQSVSISDGAISIDGPDAVEMARLDSIGGEVTVSALTGPYRFRGQANWNEEARAIRLSTAAPEADGATRFKLNVAVPKTGNTYALDGRIIDWASSPKLDGTLTGSLKLAESMRAEAARSGAAKASATTTATLPVPVALTALVTGDSQGAKLTDINLAFDQDGGKPQSLTGTVDARFQGERGMTASLSSRWLDLDRMMGWAPPSTDPATPSVSPTAGTQTTSPHSASPHATSPLTILRQMSSGLASVMPSTLPARVTVAADAVTLAGDTINSVRFGLERSGDVLRLQEFKAGFPGSTRVEATGLFPSATDAATFEGEVVLRGANLGRFLNWAGLATTGPETRNDGAFSLRSLLMTTAQSVSLREIAADLAGTIIGGSFDDDWSKRRRVDVQLEGSTIDLTALAPGSLDFRAWRNILQKAKPGANNAATPAVAALPTFLQRWLDPAEGDLTIQVRAGRLLDGSQDLRDVTIAAAMTDGRLALKRLHFESAAGQTATGQTGSGLAVAAEGDVSDLNGQPSGAMRGWIAAQDSTAVSQLMTLLGLPADTIGGNGQAGLLAPSRLAWTARFGNNRLATGSAASTPANSTAATVNSSPGASANAPATAVDLTLDGALLGRRLMAVLRLDGGLDHWREAPLDATLTLDGPDFPRLMQLLKLDAFAVGSVPPLTDGGSNAVGPNAFGQGRLSGKIVGRSAQDILVDLRFNDDGIDWSFAGRASMPPNGPANADGEIRITAADLERAVAQAGLGRNASLANLVVDGSVDVFVKDGSLRLATRGLTVNGSPVLGDIAGWPGTATTPRRFEARLNTADASVPRLLDLLLDPRGNRTAALAASKTDSVWSVTPFDLTRLGNIDGTLRLEAGQLHLTKGLALQNAVLDARLDKGRVDISALDGTAADGRWTSKWSVAAAPDKAGTIVAGSMTLTGGRLQHLNTPTGGKPGSKPATVAPSGTVDGAMTLSGQGASPAAVVATLTGNGLMEFTDGRLVGTSPTAVKAVIDGALAGRIDLSAEALDRAIQKASADSALLISARKLDIAVVDGAVRLAPLTFATPQGLATTRTTVDLANLKFDIEWLIDVVNPPSAPLYVQPAAETTSAAPDAPTGLDAGVWPRVTVVHLGHLGETHLSVQRLSVQALSRELTVRKMERDVNELERLRRLDDERIRLELERLKASGASGPSEIGPSETAAPPNATAGSVSGGLAANGETAASPEPPADGLGNKEAEDAKRRAELRAIEARRPQPAAKRVDPFRQGAAP